MNILLIHRTEEKQDFIDCAMRAFSKSGNVSNMREDEAIYKTSDRSTWLRDCASGYSIYGKPRYDCFVIIGRYLDEVSMELLEMIEQKPIWYVSDGTIQNLDKATIIDMEICNE